MKHGPFPVVRVKWDCREQRGVPQTAGSGVGTPALKSQPGTSGAVGDHSQQAEYLAIPLGWPIANRDVLNYGHD